MFPNCDVFVLHQAEPVPAIPDEATAEETWQKLSREGVVGKTPHKAEGVAAGGGRGSVMRGKCQRSNPSIGRNVIFLYRRAETTEDLAGVGLSVEMASHDIMLLLGRAQDIGLRLARHARKGFYQSGSGAGRHARRRASAGFNRYARRAKLVSGRRGGGDRCSRWSPF